jgi:hypothetical protein
MGIHPFYSILLGRLWIHVVGAISLLITPMPEIYDEYDVYNYQG